MSEARETSSRRGTRVAAPADSVLRLALPPGTPVEAQVAVNRLLELTRILAERAAQLQGALDSRVVIEQAKGVLMERFDVSPEVAFEALRRSARSRRMPVRDVAAGVLESPQTPAELGDVRAAVLPLRAAKL